jgi:WhiB family redox-sensing transcriptional regulator
MKPKKDRSNRGHGHERNVYASLLKSGPRVIPRIIGGDPFEVLAFERWMQRAACREVDPELFYPETGQYHQSRAARRICGNCPVNEDCLAHAMKTREEWGIWGGMTGKQRQKARS